MRSARHRHGGVIPLAVVGLLAMVGATDAQGADGELLGSRYDSISVVRNGEPRQLVEGTRIRVRFRRHERGDWVSWHAGCNRFAARVKIRPRRLVTGRIVGTKVRCSDALERQDRWLARFFARDPRWALRRARLGLRSGDDEIRLRRWDGPLFWRPYRSISVIRDGEPHELVEGTEIDVRFERRDRYDVVAWHAGCNYLGARVQIRPRRLLTGRITGTAVACSDALHRQEHWVTRFFARDPRWALREGRLRLRSGDNVIRLRRR